MLRLAYILLWFQLAAASLSGQSCNIEGGQYYNYSDIKGILDANNCNSCHVPGGEASDWVYGSYDQFLVSSYCSIPIVTPGDASRSLIYDKLNGGISFCGLPMPYDGEAIEQSDLHAIEAWINAGAVEHCQPFYEEVVAILEPYGCASCHTPESSWHMSTYTDMIDLLGKTQCGTVIDYSRAELSTLYQVCDGQDICETPVAGHSRLADRDVALVRDWINGGAPEGFASLPVEISRIVVGQESDYALISWTSELETGVDKYEVQRSGDALSFVTIGIVESEHHTGAATEYNLRDYDFSVGISYYRLLVRDLDGSYSYSQILSHQVKPVSNQLTLYPNVLLAGQDMTIEWHSLIDQRLSLASVVDGSGHEVATITLTEGINSYTVPDLPAGLYYLTLQDFVQSQQFRRFVLVD